MVRYLKFLVIFAVLSIIPLLFILSADVIINDSGKQAEKFVRSSYGKYLSDESLLALKKAKPEKVYSFIIETEKTLFTTDNSPKINSICRRQLQLLTLLNKYKKYARLLIAVAFFSALFVYALSSFANFSRFLLLISFKIGYIIVVVLSSVLVLSQSILLAESIYFLTSYFTGYYYPKFLLSICLTGVLTSLYLILNIFKKIYKKQIIIGYSVKKIEQQKLWNFVAEISNRLHTSVPDNIILGLGIDYYVLQSDITCLSGELKGKTLFISLSCLYWFTQEELRAIIAHELSHFVGRDTLYTLHFYSTWRRIGNVIDIYNDALEKIENNISLIVIIPVRYLLTGFIGLFQIAEGKFSRKREKIADLSGGNLASNNAMNAMASVLVKLSFFQVFGI